MVKLENGTFSSEQMEFLHSQGYLIVETVFEPSELSALCTELAAAVDRGIEEMTRSGRLQKSYSEETFEGKLARIFQDDESAAVEIFQKVKGYEGYIGGGYQGREVFNLLTHPKLLHLVEAIIGPEIVASSIYRLRAKIPGVKKTAVPWHQDSGYFAASCDSYFILTCWIPLVDTTAENGCLRILPRAHRQGIVRHFRPEPMAYLVIRNKDLPRNGREGMVAEVKRGGVIFMTNLTPHCSTPNRSDGVRWSVDFRYQAADVPNNVDFWPLENKDDRLRNIEIACFPPEADFVVRSPSRPERVVGFEDFIRRRRAYPAPPTHAPAPNRWS